MRWFLSTRLKERVEFSSPRPPTLPAAPPIVAAIDERSDVEIIWQDVYDRLIEPCITCIKNGDERAGFEYFKNVVAELAQLADVRPDQVAPRHWKQQ